MRTVLEHLQLDRGLEIHYDADLPARSGMGSSSAFTVGLLHALHALKGQMVSKHEVAMEAIHVEQDLLKETVGSQDQVLAAYGGLSHVRFLPGGEVSVRPIIMPFEAHATVQLAHVMLFYTGIKRTASTVASTYVNDIGRHRPQLRMIQNLVDEGLALLSSDKDMRCFGELLHEAWQAKQSLSKQVSNDRVDDIYQEARAAGGDRRETARRRRRWIHHVLRPSRTAGKRSSNGCKG